MAEADRRFRFAQIEFPWPLGPDDGRYVVRDGAGEPSHILVLRTLGAPQRRLLSRRRRAAPEPGPAAVATSRATVIAAGAFPAAEAQRWLSDARGETAADALAEGLRVLNGVLRAHRVAAADPAINDVMREQALVARLGYGSGDQVADGRWEAALEVPIDRRRRQRRTAALRPQERVAAMLAGREAPLACEELALRARLDLDAGRHREAALQLRVALEAGIAELARAVTGGADLARRVDELADQRQAVGAAANLALDGALDPGALEAVEHTLERLEAALRARSAAGPSASS